MTLSGFDGRHRPFDIAPGWFDLPIARVAADSAYIEAAYDSFET